MGYYINTGHNVGKSEWLITNERALELNFVPVDLSELTPEKQGLICVVNNGRFEAAGFVHNNNELKLFTESNRL